MFHEVRHIGDILKVKFQRPKDKPSAARLYDECCKLSQKKQLVQVLAKQMTGAQAMDICERIGKDSIE